MSNIFRYFIILIFLHSCSLDTKSGIWTEKKDIVKKDVVLEKDNNTKKNTITPIFSKEEILDKEFNTRLQVKLTTRLTKNSFGNNPTNNNGRVDYDGKLERISKFKYSKINNFKYHEPELIFEGENLFFLIKKAQLLNLTPTQKLFGKKIFITSKKKN